MIIAFTGAGISKASNIPTFMEQPEVRAKLFREYARKNPESYRAVIEELVVKVLDAKPNDAHVALAEYGVSVITMNIDSLHEKAGSKAIELHGKLPTKKELPVAENLIGKPVLYGDLAPAYQKGYELVSTLKRGDTFLIIGASGHTAISNDLRDLALSHGAKVIEIQQDAENEVRKTLEELTK